MHISFIHAHMDYTEYTLRTGQIPRSLFSWSIPRTRVPSPDVSRLSTRPDHVSCSTTVVPKLTSQQLITKFITSVQNFGWVTSGILTSGGEYLIHRKRAGPLHHPK